MSTWTDGELRTLYRIATRNGDKPGSSEFKAAAAKLGKSPSSCANRFARTDWHAFRAGEFVKQEEIAPRPWTPTEKHHLYALKVRLNYDYDRIAGILKRSRTSCERMFQRTDWEKVVGDPKSLKAEIAKAQEEEAKLARDVEDEKDRMEGEAHVAVNEKVIDWLVVTVDAEPDALKAMDEATFDSKLEKMLANPDSKIRREDVTATFQEIKSAAMAQIDRLGMTYPKTRKMGQGRYLVCGDSHGKHTPLGVFRLLEVINRELACASLVHMNDASDENDEISYEWQKFRNLVVLGKLNELHILKRQVYQYDVVRQRIMLGNIAVENQYDHGDFVKKRIGNVDPMTIPDMAIIPSHRQEMHSHCGYRRERLVMSPGCLCKRHVNRTNKMLIFKGGPHTRMTFTLGYHKYRKQEQDSARWENGVILVEVGADDRATAHLLRLFQTRDGWTTCYAGVAYTENGARKVEKKRFVNGDMHSGFHDPKVLDIQEQFCADYKPDVHVNVGDVLDNRALNHHMGGTKGPAFYKDGDRYVYRDSMSEIASARNVLRRMRGWAPESHLIIGNHERFASDLANQMPQIQDMLDPRFLLGTDEMGIKVTPLKATLDFGCVRFVHGDVRVWGGSGGSRMDKIANNYGPNTVIGNVHYPALRAGCYAVPMSGLLDQKYNEVDASQWMQGFAYADEYDGHCFVSLVVITGGQCIVGGKRYAARDCSSWETPPYKVSLRIDFDAVDASGSPEKGSGNPVEAPRETKAHGKPSRQRGKG